MNVYLLSSYVPGTVLAMNKIVGDGGNTLSPCVAYILNWAININKKIHSILVMIRRKYREGEYEIPVYGCEILDRIDQEVVTE